MVGLRSGLGLGSACMDTKGITAVVIHTDHPTAAISHTVSTTYRVDAYAGGMLSKCKSSD